MNKVLEYFFENISLVYNIDRSNVSYGNNNKGIVIKQNIHKDFWSAKKDINRGEIVWKEWNNQKIPFLFEKESKAEIITFNNNQATINYDIVASVFYFLSGWNELLNSQKDKYGRVPYEETLIKKLNLAGIPVVNYYFDIFREAYEQTTGHKIGKSNWGEHSFCVNLTHDIDTCKSAWLQGSFSELKKLRLFSIPKLLFSRIFAKDDWFNFKKISDLEKQNGVNSTFFFLPEKQKYGKWKNADYDVGKKDIQKVMKSLEESGHEIGVHGSFGTHIDKEKLQKEISKFKNHSIIGNRFHFLMFDPLKTVSVLEGNNLKYDTSLGFAEQIGFRRGSCTPFYLYNFEQDQISSVIEIPLILMDRSAAGNKYMGLTKEDSIKHIQSIIDETKKFNGVFTILWHNIYFSDYKYSGWKNVYVELLKYCKTNNGLLISGKEVLSKIRS